jgi:hypothetical protein
MSTEPAARTIVLINGLFLNPLSWEHWVERCSSDPKPTIEGL